MNSITAKLASVAQSLSTLILGKPDLIRLALTRLIARGHLLLQDLPGMGKTTLAQGLARVVGLSFKRLQCTSDMLPTDILGAQLYHAHSQAFEFHPGPIFTQVLLADELNRATPKAQSALLQAMEEGCVSIDGVDYPLPEPFFVIATQNPSEQSGTYLLPESQLDRFFMCLSLGYPTAQAERRLLQGHSSVTLLQQLAAQLSLEDLQQINRLVSSIGLSDPVLDYIQRLIAASRNPQYCDLGLSPRGAQVLVRAAQAWALLQQRTAVLPEDVQAVFVAVTNHRLLSSRASGVSVAQQVLSAVEVVTYSAVKRQGSG